MIGLLRKGKLEGRETGERSRKKERGMKNGRMSVKERVERRGRREKERVRLDEDGLDQVEEGL